MSPHERILYYKENAPAVISPSLVRPHSLTRHSHYNISHFSNSQMRDTHSHLYVHQVIISLDQPNHIFYNNISVPDRLIFRLVNTSCVSLHPRPWLICRVLSLAVYH